MKPQLNYYTKSELDALNIPSLATLVASLDTSVKNLTQDVYASKSDITSLKQSVADVYTKTESDGKYALKGASYDKIASDERYALATSVYKKSQVYTMTESDNRYQLKEATSKQLYMHVLYITGVGSSNEEHWVAFYAILTFYSYSSTQVDSLEAVNTYLGKNVIYPAGGYTVDDGGNYHPVTRVQVKNGASASNVILYSDTVFGSFSSSALSLSSAKSYTFTDNVIEVF